MPALVLLLCCATARALSLDLPPSSLSLQHAVHLFGICKNNFVAYHVHGHGQAARPIYNIWAGSESDMGRRRERFTNFKMVADASGDFAAFAAAAIAAFTFAACDAEVRKRGSDKVSCFPQGWHSGPTMDAKELRELVVAKWGKPYETKIHRRRDSDWPLADYGRESVREHFQRRRRDGQHQVKFYLQVFGDHVPSFKLSEDQYMDELTAVSKLISEWKIADYVREQVGETKQRPVGMGAESDVWLPSMSGHQRNYVRSKVVSIPLMFEDADGSLHPLWNDEGQEIESNSESAPTVSKAFPDI